MKRKAAAALCLTLAASASAASGDRNSCADPAIKSSLNELEIRETASRDLARSKAAYVAEMQRLHHSAQVKATTVTALAGAGMAVFYLGAFSYLLPVIASGAEWVASGAEARGLTWGAWALRKIGGTGVAKAGKLYVIFRNLPQPAAFEYFSVKKAGTAQTEFRKETLQEFATLEKQSGEHRVLTETEAAQTTQDFFTEMDKAHREVDGQSVKAMQALAKDKQGRAVSRPQTLGWDSVKAVEAVMNQAEAQRRLYEFEAQTAANMRSDMLKLCRALDPHPAVSSDAEPAALLHNAAKESS